MAEKTTKTTKEQKELQLAQKKIEEANKEIEELKQMLATAITKLETNNAQVPEVADDIVDKEEEYIDINPNKKTKITSLTFGELSIYCNSAGFLRFSDYGDTKTVTYAHLVDYINNCRRSAEAGRFYIHNQQMVEELGLSNAYEKILNDKIIAKIFNPSDKLDVKPILKNATQEQKQTIAELASLKVYKRELADMNRIDDISKSIGIDIMEKVSEMKQAAEITSSEKTDE